MSTDIEKLHDDHDHGPSSGIMRLIKKLMKFITIDKQKFDIRLQ